MRRRFSNPDTVMSLGILGGGLAAASILYLPFGDGWFGDAVRTVVGAPLVLFLPGYAMTMALIPHRSNDGGNGAVPAERSITRIERLAWAIGLSMGLAALGAFLLNLLPGGLNRTSWLILLGSTTIIAGAVAKTRQRVANRAGAAVPAAPANAGTAPDIRRSQPRPENRRPAAAFVIAALIAFLALWIARSSEDSIPHPGFAQLWLVTQTATQEATTATTAELGVHSYEEDEQRYRLVLQHEGKVVDTWSFTLPPGAMWRQRVDLQPGQPAEAQLYRDGEQTPYRRVSLQSR